MIGELAADLVAKIKTVPALENRVGITVGGKGVDPTLSKVTNPAAWVIFIGDENTNASDKGSCAPVCRMNFIVKIILDYTNDSDFVTNQYPVLENVINSISGTMATPSVGHEWKYQGQTIDELTGNRIVFDQRYSVISVY